MFYGWYLFIPTPLHHNLGYLKEPFRSKHIISYVRNLFTIKVLSNMLIIVNLIVVVVGIGGFTAKPRSRPVPKPVVYGPSTEDGQPPVLLKELSSPAPDLDASGEGQLSGPAKKKIVRKKKGIIEDTYPSYLQVSLFIPNHSCL